MSYVSISCVIIYVIGHAIGPSKCKFDLNGFFFYIYLLKKNKKQFSGNELKGFRFVFPPTGPIPTVSTTEIFRQSSRPAAFMVAGSVHWLSNFTVGLVFPFLEVRVHPQCKKQTQ